MNENELWKNICEQESIDLCKQYLSNNPFGLHVKEVQDKLKILEGCNAIDVRFLKKYIQQGIISLNGLLSAGLSRQKADSILQSLGINEEQLYQTAIQQQTAAAFGEYLKFFPNGPHAAEVQALKQRMEDAPWYEACQKNTREAYQAYAQMFPGSHAEELNNRLAAIEGAEILARQMAEIQRQQELERQQQQQMVQQDEADWLTACQTLDFNTYLNRHPNGLHAQEALNRQQGADVVRNLQSDPNAYFAGDLQQYVANGTIASDDLFRIFGPDKTNAIMSFKAPSQLPEGLPPVSLSGDTTEVYFWGTPSSGKTCALGALISSAENKGILDKLPCPGYDYMTRLANIFNSRGFCTFPYSNAVETIQEMKMRLVDSSGKSHYVTLVDLAGELFRSVYFKLNNLFLDQAKETTLDTAMKYLNDTRNKKIHFFVVEYGAQDK